MDESAVIAMLFLTVNALHDLMTGEILAESALITALSGAAAWCLMGVPEGAAVLLRFLPGLMLLLIGYLSRGGIGGGDGIMVLILSFFLTLREIFLTLFAASCTAALAGLILIIFKKKERKTAMPFVPALLAGYTVCLVIGI